MPQHIVSAHRTPGSTLIPSSLSSLSSNINGLFCLEENAKVTNKHIEKSRNIRECHFLCSAYLGMESTASGNTLPSVATLPDLPENCN